MKLGVRSIVAEIVEIRKRRSTNSSSSEAFSRLQSLEHAFRRVPKEDSEILKYFPIALVATMEGCFRVMASELIDKGEPFIGNSADLLKNYKISFEMIRALQGKRVSVGELISHAVPINRLDDIGSLMSAVSGKNFLDALRSYRSRWAIEVLRKEDAPLLADPDRVYRDISRTFELRHIFCHETATNVGFGRNEIESCILSVSNFLRTADEYVGDLMYPNAPLTQVEMNADSAENLSRLLGEVEEIKGQLANQLTGQTERIEQLEAAHQKWCEYRDLFGTFHADESKGGSIWPLEYNIIRADLARAYIDMLRREISPEVHLDDSQLAE